MKATHTCHLSLHLGLQYTQTGKLVPVPSFHTEGFDLRGLEIRLTLPMIIRIIVSIYMFLVVDFFNASNVFLKIGSIDIVQK